jgi:hypothetical protein
MRQAPHWALTSPPLALGVGPFQGMWDYTSETSPVKTSTPAPFVCTSAGSAGFAASANSKQTILCTGIVCGHHGECSRLTTTYADTTEDKCVGQWDQAPPG